jgi:hypothetical protein
MGVSTESMSTSDSATPTSADATDFVTEKQRCGCPGTSPQG